MVSTFVHSSADDMIRKFFYRIMMDHMKDLYITNIILIMYASCSKLVCWQNEPLRAIETFNKHKL